MARAAGTGSGGAVAIVTLVDAGDPPPAPPREEPAKVDVAADIPVIEAEVGHLTPDPAALALSDRLRKGEILRLRLWASYTNVDTALCKENLLAACHVTWAVECADGYTPPVVPLDGQWPAGVDPYNMHCPKIGSLRTVNRRGASVAGWTYAHGTFTLEGFYVVEGVGFGQGILQPSLREIPAEVARQLVG